jgi:hypothetical protein
LSQNVKETSLSGSKKKETMGITLKNRGRLQHHPVLLGHVFKNGLKAPGLKRLGDVLELTKGWQGVVGPRFASKLLPVLLSNGILSVATPHPAWSSEAQNYAKFFIKNIQERFPDGPKVRSFRFFYAPHLFMKENSIQEAPSSLELHGHHSSSGLEPSCPKEAQSDSRGLHWALDRLAKAYKKKIQIKTTTVNGYLCTYPKEFSPVLFWLFQP